MINVSALISILHLLGNIRSVNKASAAILTMTPTQWLLMTCSIQIRAHSDNTWNLYEGAGRVKPETL